MSEETDTDDRLDAEARLFARTLLAKSFERFMKELHNHDNQKDLFSPVVYGINNEKMTSEVEKVVWDKVKEVAENLNPPRKYVNNLEVEVTVAGQYDPPRCQIKYFLGDINLNEEFGMDVGFKINHDKLEATEDVDDESEEIITS